MTEVEGLLDATLPGQHPLAMAHRRRRHRRRLFLMLLLRRLIQAHYRRLAATPQAEFMETPLQVASRTTVLFLVVASVTLALLILELPPRWIVRC